MIDERIPEDNENEMSSSTDKSETESTSFVTDKEEKEEFISIEPTNIELPESEQDDKSDNITSEKPELRSASIIKLEEQLDSMSKESKQVLTEVREMHKLYHNEYAGRLHSMQEKLDYYHQIENGRAFEGILSSIAQIYCNYENLADNIDDPKLKKSVRYLLLDLCELLETYGMKMIHSEVGEKRNPQHRKIQERILTENASLHDTIAKSYGIGFYLGNRTIIPERVDVYFYDVKVSTEMASDIKGNE